MNPDTPQPVGQSLSALIRFISLTLVFLAMVALAGMAYFTERGIAASRDRVVHTYQVRSQLNDLQLQIARAQAEENSVVFAHENSRLPQIREQFALAGLTVETLQRLLFDNGQQRQRLAELGQQLKRNLSSLEVRAVGIQATLRERQQQALIDRRKQIDTSVRDIEDSEESLLAQQLHDWDYLFKRNVLMLGLAFAIVTLLLIYNFRELVKQVKRTRDTEERERQNARSYRLMSARILELQDLERRRIARELHDSVGQYLAGLKINLSQITPGGRIDPAVLVRQTLELTDFAIQEVRTISHLLHPPLLEELGFLPAARWYLDEYGKRSQMNVALEVQEPIERLPREVEIALFRVLQESLTNVYRHAAASAVDVRLACRNEHVTLTIADDGKGIPLEILSRFHDGSAPGIGLGGMRERLAEFGGVINVESSSGGSVVQAIIPTHATCKAPAANLASE